MCHLFRVSKNFMLQRVMSLFSVEIFRLTVPKNFVGEPFSVSFFPGIEEVRISEWVGGVSRSAVEFFCLTVAKNFVGQPFSVSLISGMEKFYASEGFVTIFCRKFLSHSAAKIRRGTLLCWVSEKFW